MRFIALSLLVACSTSPKDEDTDPDTDDTEDPTDTDVDDDTDLDDDTDVADTDLDDTDVDEPVTPHDCLDNHGIFGLTSRWTYTWKNGNRTGGRAITVTAYDNDQNTATLRIQSNWTDAAATFVETITAQHRCDAEFLYLTGRTVDSTLDVGFGSPTVVADTYSYDEPVRLQSNVTHEAPTPTMWTKRTHGTRTHGDGSTTDFDTEVMCWLVQPDQVGYSPWTPDHYQCGSPPVFPDPQPTVTEEYRWQEGVGDVNNWDSRLTDHVE